MQLLELTMKNWGPFFGEHTIPLSVQTNAPVVLFRGENGRGKTSLLRAIVWSLYGKLKEQDGRTPLPVEKMVNLDALKIGDAEFGVTLKFAHNETEYVLHRSGTARGETPETSIVLQSAVDLLPVGGMPYPFANIPDVIDGIIGADIADFFFFDGEMLNRFEERLREERYTSQGFVRMQVERALGLPFMTNLKDDLEVLQNAIATSMDQALRKMKKNTQISEKFQQKKDDLASVEKDLEALRQKANELLAQINDYEGQLAKVEEIKDLFHERKGLEAEIDRGGDGVKDIQATIAGLAETYWWLPVADLLVKKLESAEAEIEAAENADRERYKLQFEADQVARQLASGVCPTCGRPIVVHNETELRSELSALEAHLATSLAPSVDEARRQRDRLRRFANAPAVLQRVHEQEKDLRREKLRIDKAWQRVRVISEQISGNGVNIDVLEQTLVDRKATKIRSGQMLAQLEERRQQLKAEVARIGTQIAAQPEVGETERRLQASINEAFEIVGESFVSFREAMRERVSQATSDLFLRLTTEKDYRGIRISDDYQLSIIDDQDRSLSMISAGVNQILTMAFIGALGECSVEEAPMVMDTPFGRLDRGHRSAILSWVSQFETQVILFVQSGEYDPQQLAQTLGGKVGREYTIDRLGVGKSEVNAA